MHVVFIEPRFPANQRQFIRALAEVGATVTAIGEGSKDSLDDELKRWLTHYEQVTNVCERGSGAARGALHPAPQSTSTGSRPRSRRTSCRPRSVREAAGIPGTIVRTAWLCRDKPSMKEVLREGGVPCAQSTAAASRGRGRARSSSTSATR